jgi:hypothetical protein
MLFYLKEIYTMATQTSKIMHIINDSGIISIRRPYDPAVAATQKVPERYRSSEHFMDHERSAFLEHVLANERYIQITAHAFGQDELDDVSNWLSGFAGVDCVHARVRTQSQKPGSFCMGTIQIRDLCL